MYLLLIVLVTNTLNYLVFLAKIVRSGNEQKSEK